jgi:2-hydroxy-3-oxopropionate reductase
MWLKINYLKGRFIMEKIGFIGLGIMGLPMAKNLIDAGYQLTAFDVNEKALAQIIEYGAAKGQNSKDVSQKNNVVITMLPDSPQVKEVVLGKDGVMEGIGKGKVLIDMSSIAPLVSREIAKRLEEKEVEMLDAPVSGGQEKAEKGTLAIMVGGKQEVFERYKHILAIMGGTVTHVGDVGAGETTKLVNQVIVAINIAAVAEGLVLGKRAGVDPERIFDAIKGGLAGSQCMTDKAPRMFTGSYEPGFKIKLHIKDLNNVFETSKKLGIAMPLSSQVMEMMKVLFADNYEEADHGSLAVFYEKNE